MKHGSTRLRPRNQAGIVAAAQRVHDAEVVKLYEELRGYPGGQPEADVHNDVVVRLRMRYKDHELAFFSIVASFGTPNDITVDELAIESFFPADEATASTLRAYAAA
jgi:hypothetical protein